MSSTSRLTARPSRPECVRKQALLATIEAQPWSMIVKKGAHPASCPIITAELQIPRDSYNVWFADDLAKVSSHCGRIAARVRVPKMSSRLENKLDVLRPP